MIVHGDADFQGLALSVENRTNRQGVEIVVAGSFLLPAVGAEMLAEIALLVKESHARQGQVEVAGRLQVVARKYAETPGIDRQTVADGELGGKIGDAHVASLAVKLTEPGLPVVQVVEKTLANSFVMGPKADILGRLVEALLADQTEHGDRIPTGGFPKVSVQPVEQRAGFVIPRPAQVVGEFRQLFDLGRQGWSDVEGLDGLHRLART